MSRLLRVAAVLALALLAGTAREVRARDDDPVAESLVFRIFDVGALIGPRTDFVPGLVPGGGLQLESAQHPLFGFEGEEPWLPVGTIDELAEHVKCGVEPRGWFLPGVDVWAVGGTKLLIRARRPTMDGVARFLTDLEARVLATITIEVRVLALPGSGGAAPGMPPVDAPALASTIVTGFPGQRVDVSRVRQRHLLGGYDAVAGTTVATGDPAVLVESLGLSVSATAHDAAGEDSLRVDLRAAFAESDGEARAVAVGAGRHVDATPHDLCTIHSAVVVRRDRWTLAGAATRPKDGGRLAFLVRASRNPYRGQVAPLSLPSFDAPPKPVIGPFQVRRVHLGALRAPPSGVVGPLLGQFSGRGSDADHEWTWCPTGPMESDVLAAFLKDTLPPHVLEEPGTVIDLTRDHALLRGRPGLLDAIEARIEDLKRALLWTVTARGEVVDVPDALAAKLLAAEGSRLGAPLLDAPGEQALFASIRAGESTLLNDAVVVSPTGEPNSSVGGRWHPFVADYDVKFGGGAFVAVPWVRSCVSGFAFDIEPRLTGGSDAVHVEVHALRAVRTSLRTAETPHGPIELPVMDLLRVRTSLTIPLGRTAIVGAGGEGGRTRLLLVTPTLRRPGD